MYSHNYKRNEAYTAYINKKKKAQIRNNKRRTKSILYTYKQMLSSEITTKGKYKNKQENKKKRPKLTCL